MVLKGCSRKLFGPSSRDEAAGGVCWGQFRKGLVWQTGGFGFCPKSHGELLKCFKQKTMKDGVYDLTNHPSNPVEDRLKWETVQGN